MKALKHKLLFILAIAAFLATITPVVTPVNALPVDDSSTSCSNWNNQSGSDSTPPSSYNSSDCDKSKGGPCKVTVSTEGGKKSYIIKCSTPSGTTSTTATAQNDPTLSDDCKQNKIEDINENNCGIIGYIVTITNVMSALVGVIIISMMIIGGIQYSAAGADPSKIQAAKKKITNAILALFLFIFGFAIVQWLVPGGIF